MQKGFAGIIILIIILILAGLAGAYYFGKVQNTKTQPQITVTPAPSAKVDETVYTEASRSANWKTYTNQEFSFQINYPSDWGLKENKTLQNLALITITISSPSGNTLLDIWVNNGNWNEVEKELQGKASKTRINDYESFVIDDIKSKVKTYTILSKNKDQVIQILYGPSADSSSTEIKTLDQILSTFKFLP